MTHLDRVSVERGLRAAVLAGDETAWRTWYDAHDAELRRYVRWRCAGFRELTDDVVQEAWMTAVRRIRTFDPAVGSFAGWVCGIAGLVIKNHLRKLRRSTAHQRVLVDVSTGERAGENGQSLQTARALSELPPRYERVLRAKYLEGMSVNEIAESWGDSPKAIESVLTRARDHFRSSFERLGRDDG